MKKSLWILLGVLLGIVALALGAVLLVRNADCPYCKKIKALFSDADFTVMPMGQDKAEE